MITLCHQYDHHVSLTYSYNENVQLKLFYETLELYFKLSNSMSIIINTMSNIKNELEVQWSAFHLI